MTTRKDLEAALTAKGIEGAALEALLRETAPDRHRARVEAARLAAEEYYLEAIGVSREDTHPDNLVTAAAAILWADTVGVGGRDGVGGDATERHPAFAGCGKGRKQATDGAAWSAAIREAAESMVARGYFHVTEAGLAFTSDHVESGTLVNHSVAPLAWRRSLGREGLRRAAGLPAWHPDVPFAAEAEEQVELWARLVNSLEAEYQADDGESESDETEAA